MPLMLTAIERRLQRTLASDPTRIWVTPELLGQLWQRRSEGSIAVIDRTAARVRAVLDEVDPATRWLPHVWGVGYALVDPGEVKVVVMVRGLR
jgi:DNA-binding response OmpR family regulator